MNNELVPVGATAEASVASPRDWRARALPWFRAMVRRAREGANSG